MKVNLKALSDPEFMKSKMQFLVITRWPTLSAPTDYKEQLHHLRRAYDALRYMEGQFNQGTILMAHKEVARPAMHFIVAVDNHTQLDEFIKLNPAHDRYAEREVIPMVDFESGHEVFEKMITNIEALAQEEEQAKKTPRGHRPFPWDKP
ncbi:hypothetical protein [Caballeronia sp. LZ035]|uniref:hypothetical protein n=1 Tax=Caballeronia sp. LZ035 TaxID=3038568 RepID=UPI00285889A5|nr:hypothetical protein [Caballeronia sp. LZ035]MDR5759693.1 hypothetical protein [Caballeronia sp. LZ035]